MIFNKKDKQPEIKDEVIRQAADTTKDKFEETMKELVDRSARSDSKTDYLFETKIKGMFDKSTETIAKEFDRRSSELDEKGLADDAYIAAKTDIRIDSQRSLTKLYDRFRNQIMVAGGKDKLLRDEQELLDFIENGQDILYNINLGELVNSATGKEYFKDADERNAPLFEIMNRLAEGKELTDQDYAVMAERIIDVTNMKDVGREKDDMKKFLDRVAMVSEIEDVFSVVKNLNAPQRYILGKKLIDSKGRKGAQTVFDLTLTGFFSVKQTDKLFNEGKVPRDIMEKHNQSIANGDYEKAQKAMQSVQEDALKNLQKHMHQNAANEKMSYFNILAYEIGLKAIGAIIVLNAFVNIKNKDLVGLAVNVPMWAGIAAGAGIYDSVTEGEVRQLLSKKSTPEEIALENKRKKEAFAVSLSREPQLSSWFTANIKTLDEGFAKINPKHEEGSYKFEKWEDLGVKDPGEKDGKTGELLREKVTAWYEFLRNDLGILDPKEQEEFLVQAEKGEFEEVKQN